MSLQLDETPDAVRQTLRDQIQDPVLLPVLRSAGRFAFRETAKIQPFYDSHNH